MRLKRGGEVEEWGRVGGLEGWGWTDEGRGEGRCGGGVEEGDVQREGGRG